MRGQHLAGIEGLESEATAGHEDLSVRPVNYWKETKKGRQNHPRWYASWQEGDKVRHVYMGSVKKMSQAEAMQKVRKLKAGALGRT